MCYYTGKKMDTCGEHFEKAKPTVRRHFMCAKILSEWNENISKLYKTWDNIKVAGKNGVAPREYSFKAMRFYGAEVNTPHYSDVMEEGCASNGDGWKPVCVDPKYDQCKEHGKDGVR